MQDTQMQLNFLIDENLEHYHHFFSDFGVLHTKAGRKITAQDVHDKDILLVRSVTPVNASLLDQSPVQFVGSATIGTDHLDLNFLQQRQITWSNAAGCNAQAVAEYVITAIHYIKPMYLNLNQKISLGIIGLGNVGTRLARLGQMLGWDVKGYDPFVQHQHIQQVSWEEVLNCDVISLHVPLTKQGDHATYHLMNQQAFTLMNPKSLLINAARGEVISEQALLQDIAKTGRSVVLDVFEHEPTLSQALLDAVTVVTPHIAGYSLEGKIRGTEMIYQALCQHLGKIAEKDMMALLPTCEQLFDQTRVFNTQLAQYLPQLYNIQHDDQALRACCQNGSIEAEAFDQLRKHYALRREWSAYGLKMENEL